MSKTVTATRPSKAAGSSRKPPPSPLMQGLADRLTAAGWKVQDGARGFVGHSPRNDHVPFARLATDQTTYDRAVQRLIQYGLKDDEKEAAAGTTAKQRLDRDRAANERRLEAAEQRAAAVQAPAPPAPAPAPAQVPSPAQLLERPGVAAAPSNGNGNGHSAPAAKAAAVEDAPKFIPPPLDLPKRAVPAALRGVAGLSSLDPRMDLSVIVIDPAAAPPPGYHQVTVYQLVTPELAKKWLDREVGYLDDGTLLHQRPILRGDVNRYKGILERDKRASAEDRPGEWAVAEDSMLAPEAPINTGGVIDGRHRYTAIYESGIPAIMKITYNTPPKVFLTLDKGRKRTTGDTLVTLGYKSTTHLGSAVKALYCWRMWQADPAGPYWNWRNWSRMRPTDTQLHDLIQAERHPHTGESLIEPHTKPGANMMSHIQGVPSAGIAFRILVTDTWAKANPDGSHNMPDTGRELLEEFCEYVAYDDGLRRGHPCKTLREWILKGTGGVVRSDKREFQLNGLLRAWSAFAQGETLGRIIVESNKGDMKSMPEVYVPSLRYKAGRAKFGI